MKKSLLALPLLAAAIGFGACSQQAGWNREERQQMRNALKQYRQMVYLQDLTEPEFVIFSDNVATDLEHDYPVYATFVKMPGLNDTIDAVVITTIIDELDADAHNMRHLYPYRYLVEQGVLPEGLDRSGQRAFYRCFAAKVNRYYSSAEEFFNAILADTTDNSRIATMQAQCADELFDFDVEIDEIAIYGN
ncbi:MAG: hypothetical protein J1D86_06025 [Alistipes sp.]|nr:hypothetical protein [Alistipes sp.]